MALISPGRATRFRWPVLGPDPLTTAHMLLPHDAMRTALSQLGFGHGTMTLRDTTCRSDALIVATTHALLDAGRSSAAEAYVHSAAAFLAMHVLARYAATSVAVDELTPRMLSVFRDAMGGTPPCGDSPPWLVSAKPVWRSSY